MKYASGHNQINSVGIRVHFLRNFQFQKEEEIVFTEDEEAIKATLESNEPLPTELLDSIIKPWWTMEPYR